VGSQAHGAAAHHPGYRRDAVIASSKDEFHLPGIQGISKAGNPEAPAIKTKQNKYCFVHSVFFCEAKNATALCLWQDRHTLSGWLRRENQRAHRRALLIAYRQARGRF
jgi:hypothetical protein